MGIPTPKAIHQVPASQHQFLVMLRTGRTKGLAPILHEHPQWAQKTFPELNGHLPLAFVAAKGYADLVALLLPFSNPFAIDARQRTALMVAIEANQFECAQLLIPVSPLAPLRTDAEGPLHLAARLGCRWILRELLAAGATSTPLNGQSTVETPLNLATQHQHEACVKALLPWARQPGLGGRTALMRSAVFANPSLLSLLLPHSDPDAVDQYGNTALFYAASADHAKAVELLLPHSSARMCNARGESALFHALNSPETACFDLLVEHSETRAVDHTGNNLLLFGLRFQSPPSEPILHRLLKLVDPRALNQNAESALMLAVTKGLSLKHRLRLIRLLLPVSDLKAQNLEGKDALELCIERGNREGWSTSEMKDCADWLVGTHHSLEFLQSFLAPFPTHDFPRIRAQIEAHALAQSLRSPSTNEDPCSSLAAPTHRTIDSVDLATPEGASRADGLKVKRRRL